MVVPDFQDESVKESAGASAPGTPLNRMVVALVALLGLLVALYMMAYAAGLTGPILCNVVSTIYTEPFLIRTAFSG